MSETIIAMRGTVYEKGYGLIAKKVMQDKSISIKAKALYAYFSSFAGATDMLETREAFPSIAKILDDLGISKDSFYKYRKELEAAGYITVEQDKDNEKKFKNNTYYIEAVPCPKISETEPFPKKPDTALPDTVNSETNNNKSLKNNILNNSLREREERADAASPSGDTPSFESDKNDEMQYTMLQEITKRVFGMPRANQVDVESIWNHWHNRFPQYDLTHLYAVIRATQTTARVRDDLTGIIVKRLPSAKKALIPIKMQAIDYIATLRRELKDA